VRYITQKEFEAVNEKLVELAGKIGKFISYLESQRSQGHFVRK